MIQRPVAERLPLLRNANPDRRSEELCVDSRGLRNANTPLCALQKKVLITLGDAGRNLANGTRSDRDLTTKSPLCYISVTQVPAPYAPAVLRIRRTTRAIPSSSLSSSVPVLPHRDAAPPPGSTPVPPFH